MGKRTFLMVFLIFIAAILVMPFAMPNCGQHGFHMGFSSGDSACGRGVDFGHLTFMRSLIFIGLITTIFLLVRYFFSQKLFSLISQFKEQFLLNFNYFLKKQISLGRMKPFDKLLVAYSSGLIQPKTFCLL